MDNNTPQKQSSHHSTPPLAPQSAQAPRISTSRSNNGNATGTKSKKRTPSGKGSPLRNEFTPESPTSHPEPPLNIPIPPQFRKSKATGNLSSSASSTGSRFAPRSFSSPLLINSNKTTEDNASYTLNNGEPSSLRDSIAGHLVQQTEEQPSDTDTSQQFGSVSHSLLGGAITRDIYAWYENDKESSNLIPPASSNGSTNGRAPLKKSRSEADLTMLRAAGDGDVESGSAYLRQPGGFRRHFVHSKAERENKQVPNWITKNFVEFLGLYGHFAGGIYSSEEETDDDDDEQVSGDEKSGESDRGLLDYDTSDGEDFDGYYQRSYRDDLRQQYESNLAQSNNDAGPRQKLLSSTSPAPSLTEEELNQHDEKHINEATPLLANNTLERSPSSIISATSPQMQRSRRASHQSLNRRTESGTSNSKAFFLLLKAFVGTGILFLPKAFSNGGLFFSIVCMVVVGYLTLHCMLLLSECSQRVGGSYGDIGEKLYGVRVREIVVWSIAISQMGFCCAYMIFVSKNIRSLVCAFTSPLPALISPSDPSHENGGLLSYLFPWDASPTAPKVVLPEWLCIAIQLPFYIPLSWVRKIKHFSITSLIADVFILIGILYITYRSALTISIQHHASTDLVYWINLDKFPLFIGTAIFAYEGIGLILPISSSMSKPQDFSRILSLVILVIGVVMMIIGVLGYLAFGEHTATIIFNNLDAAHSPSTKSVQILYVCAIAFSFPLTVYPSIRITEQYLFGHRATGKTNIRTKWMKNFYRVVLVSFLGVVSYLGSSSLDKFVSFIGNFACIPLSFIYPSLFHAKIYSNIADGDEEIKGKKWIVIKDWCLATFGIVCMIYSTYVTMLSWNQGDGTAPDVCSPS